MGELKDWTGDDMTQWTEYRVNMAEELEQRCIDRWDELWKFNGGLEPKFWFGDRVKFQERSVVIVGMEWLEDKFAEEGTLEDGWWYLTFGKNGSWRIHESNLQVIDTGEEQCQGF
ncbi:hypothetical protein [Kamptonema formosum]|uniref:hypothetical protein n=1 Tax=Kamptonema formosum TaxID=331992 RepID=UPI00034C190F|nr:hypothetical protein [Kamptonema formosum]